MIALLTGIIHGITGDRVTINVQGVGYEVCCTRHCVSNISIGSPATIVTYTEMREASISLFGFADEIEKQVFLLLIRVKGVGARSASEILSLIDKQDLLRCIGTSDVTRLQSVKGIGKKTAERIVVELRDRVAEFVAGNGDSGLVIERIEGTPVGDAAEALVALGFSRKDAEKAIAQVAPDRLRGADSGELVREALRFI